MVTLLAWLASFTRLACLRSHLDRLGSQVIPDAETREFVLTNLVMDAETKTYKWKVNVASLLHHLHNRDLTGFSPAGGEPWVGPCLWIKGTRSSYVDPTRHMETMKRCPKISELPVTPIAWHHAQLDRTALSFSTEQGNLTDSLQSLTRFFPGTELCTMDTGHWPHHERPQAKLSKKNLTPLTHAPHP